MTDDTKVLIAGAGWRVSAFVLPALLAIGVQRARIHLLRRQDAKPNGRLADIDGRRWETLDPAYDLIVNCVSRDALIAVQSRLVERFPLATQYCDTPVIDRMNDLMRARKLARRARLFSLEDWPLMPNLTPFFTRCRQDANPWELRAEHIGVAAHFLAAARTAFGAAGGAQNLYALRRQGALAVRAMGSGNVAVHTGEKDYARSKLVWWDGAAIVEDFFDLRRAGDSAPPPRSPEVIERVLDGDKLHYSLGEEVYRTVTIPPAVTEMILSEPGRRGVHELDKCVALMDIFRGAASGSPSAYGYLAAAWDAVSTWSVDRSRVALTRSRS